MNHFLTTPLRSQPLSMQPPRLGGKSGDPVGSTGRLPATCCFLQLADARDVGWAPRGQGGCLCQAGSHEPSLELGQREKVAGG